MSSRYTGPVSKLTRSLSTTPSIGRPSQLLNNAPKTASGAARKRSPSPVVADEPGADSLRHHSTTSTTSTPPHRPAPPRAARTIPFMQTFHHSAPKPSPSLATMSAAPVIVLPNLFQLEQEQTGGYDPYAHIRVPLLPDNTSPPAGFRLPEAADAPLPLPEIVVVAPDPAQELPSALTEIEGMGVDGVELKFAHELGREGEAAESFEMGRGMIRDLWKGMMGSSNSSSSGGKSAA